MKDNSQSTYNKFAIFERGEGFQFHIYSKESPSAGANNKSERSIKKNGGKREPATEEV